MFLALFMLVMASIRAFFIRFYQAVLCAGIAIMFTTLAETNSQNVTWNKLRSYAIPWLLGQALALAVNVLLFPDPGARALAAALHQSLEVMQVRYAKSWKGDAASFLANHSTGCSVLVRQAAGREAEATTC
jgi:hypothetical protein